MKKLALRNFAKFTGKHLFQQENSDFTHNIFHWCIWTMIQKQSEEVTKRCYVKKKKDGQAMQNPNYSDNRDKVKLVSPNLR